MQESRPPKATTDLVSTQPEQAGFGMTFVAVLYLDSTSCRGPTKIVSKARRSRSLLRDFLWWPSCLLPSRDLVCLRPCGRLFELERLKKRKRPPPSPPSGSEGQQSQELPPGLPLCILRLLWDRILRSCRAVPSCTPFAFAEAGGRAARKSPQSRSSAQCYGKSILVRNLAVHRLAKSCARKLSIQ